MSNHSESCQKALLKYLSKPGSPICMAGREAVPEWCFPGAGAQPGGHPRWRCQAVSCVLPPQRSGYQLGWDFWCIFSISGMELAGLDVFLNELHKRGSSSQKMQFSRAPTFLWNRKEKCLMLFSDTRTFAHSCLPGVTPCPCQASPLSPA